MSPFVMIFRPVCFSAVHLPALSYLQILKVFFSFLSRQKERDLELAARIGQSLLKQNQELTARNEMIDEQLEIAKEEVRRERAALNRLFLF